MNKLFIYSLTVLFTLIIWSCNQTKREKVVYEGKEKDAIIDNILTRRSIRKYTEQPIEKSKLDTLMKCALYAPSAVNAQPWEVRVIQNIDLINEINNRWKKTASEKDATLVSNLNNSVLHNAPVLIIIAGDSNNPKSRVDVGIMLQTILLGAHGLDLGTCPIGMLIPTLIAPENQDLIKMIGIPDGYETMGVIALGYADEVPEAPMRYSEKIKFIE